MLPSLSGTNLHMYYLSVSEDFGLLDNEYKSSFYLDTKGHHGYHGLINEDETRVAVTPTIKVRPFGGKKY